MKKLYIIGGLVVAALSALLVLWRAVVKKRKAAAEDKTKPSPALESREIDQAFHDAEAQLAAANVNGGSRIADFPVYLLLGDPGAAKTSAMAHSGLEPELLSGQVYQNSDILSTDGVNLWFA